MDRRKRFVVGRAMKRGGERTVERRKREEGTAPRGK